MRLSIIPLLITILIGGCTRKKETSAPKHTEKVLFSEIPKVPTMIESESPFRFRFQPKLLNSQHIAQLDQWNVTALQAYGNDKSIQRIIEKMRHQVIYVTYYWALGKLSKPVKDIKIELSFEKPKVAIDDILRSFGIQANPKIQFQFLNNKEERISAKIQDQVYTEAQLALGSLQMAKSPSRGGNPKVRE